MKKSSLIMVGLLVLVLGVMGYAGNKVVKSGQVAQAIALDRHGVPTVWIDGNGQLHGHLQARKYWFGYKAIPEAAYLTEAQVASATKAEAEYAAVKAEKAQKLAEKAQAKAKKLAEKEAKKAKDKLAKK
jgi:hypothetical protein